VYRANNIRAEQEALSTPLEHILAQGEWKVAAPLSPAVKLGKLAFVSASPSVKKRVPSRSGISPRR